MAPRRGLHPKPQAQLSTCYGGGEGRPCEPAQMNLPADLPLTAHPSPSRRGRGHGRQGSVSQGCREKGTQLPSWPFTGGQVPTTGPPRPPRPPGEEPRRGQFQATQAVPGAQGSSVGLRFPPRHPSHSGWPRPPPNQDQAARVPGGRGGWTLPLGCSRDIPRSAEDSLGALLETLGQVTRPTGVRGPLPGEMLFPTGPPPSLSESKAF